MEVKIGQIWTGNENAFLIEEVTETVTPPRIILKGAIVVNGIVSDHETHFNVNGPFGFDTVIYEPGPTNVPTP